MSVSNEPPRHDPPRRDDEDERDRRATNIFLLCAAIVLVGVGIWLVNALVDARKADDCLSSGRRNCVQSIPFR